MDSFIGVARGPTTLHKYVYGNADPVNHLDPSGRFGVFEATVVNTIISELVQLQIAESVDLLSDTIEGRDASRSAGEDNLSPFVIGAIAVAGGYGGYKLIKLLSKKCRQSCSLITRFNGTERHIISETKAIEASGLTDDILWTLREGKSKHFYFRELEIIVEPDLPSSGFSFADTGFVIGRDFLALPHAERTKTYLHELYRLRTSNIIGRQAGADGRQTRETQAAFEFAERAYDEFFR